MVTETEVIEVQPYLCNGKKLYYYTPFRDDLLADLPANSSPDMLDTLVAPAQREGFEREFLENQRWFPVRIASTMLGKIKYIAAYQVAPVSAITHIAEVDRIEQFEDTEKRIIYFKENTVRAITPVELGEQRALAPQSIRYTSYQKLVTAGTLADLWR